MDKKSELDCYLYFMWNNWSRNICFDIFGERLGEHIWIKWTQLCQKDGAVGAPASLYAICDSNVRNKLKQRAYEQYN